MATFRLLQPKQTAVNNLVSVHERELSPHVDDVDFLRNMVEWLNSRVETRNQNKSLFRLVAEYQSFLTNGSNTLTDLYVDET
jgi:hypothetical protein